MFVMVNPVTGEYGMTPNTDTKDLQKARTWRSKAYALNASGYTNWSNGNRTKFTPTEVHLVLGPLPAVVSGSPGPCIGGLAPLLAGIASETLTIRKPTTFVITEETGDEPTPAPVWAGFE